MTRIYSGRPSTKSKFPNIPFEVRIFHYESDPHHPLHDDPELTRHWILILADRLKTKLRCNLAYFAGLVISHRPKHSLECLPVKGPNTTGTVSTELVLHQFEGLEDGISWKTLPLDDDTSAGIRTQLVFPAACLHQSSYSKIDRRSLLALNYRFNQLMSAGHLTPNPPSQRVQAQTRSTVRLAFTASVSDISQLSSLPLQQRNRSSQQRRNSREHQPQVSAAGSCAHVLYEGQHSLSRPSGQGDSVILRPRTSRARNS